MNRRIVDQVGAILNGSVTAEELAEIEKAVKDAKGNVLIEDNPGFWEGKTSCWEMCTCPPTLRKECPAFKNRNLPCWEVEGTYCKLDDYGATGRDTGICRVCRVYKRWGENKNLEIKLCGQGFTPTFASQSNHSHQP